MNLALPRSVIGSSRAVSAIANAMTVCRAPGWKNRAGYAVRTNSRVRREISCQRAARRWRHRSGAHAEQVHDRAPGRVFCPVDGARPGRVPPRPFMPIATARRFAGEAPGKQISAIRKASKETHDAPRLPAEPADDGVHIGRRRVERLMKAKGLSGVSRRRSVATAERGPRARPARDPVDRNLHADAPDVLRGERAPANDITHLPARAGFVYPCARQRNGRSSL